MITSAFLERAQSTRNNPKKMCPLSNKILLSPLLLGEVSESTLQGLKGIRMLPSRGLVQPMDILHRGPTHCARASDTSKFGSSKFCFRWNELPVDGDQRSAPGALGQQRAGRQKTTCIWGFLFSEIWGHNRGRYTQVGDEVSLVTLWQGTNFFSGKVLTRRSLPSFHFALLLHLHILDNGYWTKGVTKKNHKHKESKLRLNTTLPLLSRFRLTKAGRSNNYSAQTSGFFRCPLIFIFSLRHHPH